MKLKETRAENELFEHRFWLQIMGDHGRFIINSLSLREKGDIEKAEKFIIIFDQLLSQVRISNVTTDLSVLNRNDGYRTQPDTQVPLLPI